jgi:hypothetical protein
MAGKEKVSNLTLHLDGIPENNQEIRLSVFIDKSSDEDSHVSLLGLFGSAPDATGDQSSASFIRALRDGWH